MHLVSIFSLVCLLIQNPWRVVIGFPGAARHKKLIQLSRQSVPFSILSNSIKGSRTAARRLLSIRAGVGDDVTSADILLSSLHDLIAQAPKNGIGTQDVLEQQIQRTCRQLEAITPNRSPTRTPSLLNGFWYMLWTNYGPPGPSSGKLGPFVGDVYQDLQLPTDGDPDGVASARNIFRLDFPPIMGELFATPKVQDDTTVAITFCHVGTKLAGIVPLGPKVEFETGKEVRLWDHAYVDSSYRILYARNAANGSDDDAKMDSSRGFLYVMRRADEDRFATGIV